MMDKEIATDASIPGNGFRLADKYHTDRKEWHRTCLDLLETGDIFRFVTQKGTTDKKIFRVVEPLEMVKIRDTSSLNPNAMRLAYHEGKMKFEEISDVAG